MGDSSSIHTDINSADCEVYSMTMIKIDKDLLISLRNSLLNDHNAATIYEEDEHDPFNGKNGGKQNTGECKECELLLGVNKVLAKEKASLRGKLGGS